MREALAAGLGEHVLLVGHDPDFSMAVHALTGAQVRMKKGGLAGVEKGEIKVLLRPAELVAIAATARQAAAPPPARAGCPRAGRRGRS